MAELSNTQLITAVGIICQLMIDVLLWGLFVLLQRHAGRQPWFRSWTRAWGFLAFALACVTWSYFGPLPADWQAFAVPALQFIYLAAKMAFVLFLVAGYLAYTGTSDRLMHVNLVLPASAGFAALAWVFSRGVMPTVIWQGIPSVLLFTLACVMTARMPARRRTLGTRLSSAMLGVMGVLWLIYITGFSPQLQPMLPGVAEPLLFVARNNPFFDLAVHMMLAFGMVLILLEDAKREVDAAHIKLDRAHRRLRDQSLRDPLTACLNRRAYAEGAGLELVELGGAVVVADLDNLKDINDAHGHQAGDALLQYCAHVLRAELRAADSLYRWGGDEFLLLLPEGDAKSVMSRLSRQLQEADGCELPNGKKVALEISIGAADFRDGGDFESAIHAADRAMYRQKRTRKQRRTIRPV